MYIAPSIIVALFVGWSLLQVLDAWAKNRRPSARRISREYDAMIERKRREAEQLGITVEEKAKRDAKLWAATGYN